MIEKAAQTASQYSHSDPSRSLLHDYKTVINVYENCEGADIIELIDNKPHHIYYGNKYPVQVSDSMLSDSSLAQRNVRFSEDKKNPDPIYASDTFNSTDSFNTKAMSAINAIDEAVASEIFENDGRPEIAGTGKLMPFINPPPPPPAPPPPPPLQAKDDVQMSVKRINWEKLERVEENTIWAQVFTKHKIIKYEKVDKVTAIKGTGVLGPFAICMPM